MIKKIKNIYKNIDITIFTCILILSIYSILIIYSASNQNIYIVYKRIIHLCIGLFIMIFVSQFKSIFYRNYTYIFYIICNILLIIVYIKGHIIKGAKRWINIGIFQFQPSETIKLILPIIIAQYISNNYPLKTKDLFKTTIIILIPTILVYLQPDLGTSILIIVSGMITLYLGGINKKMIFISIILSIISIPILWNFFLHNYQKERIITLFNNNKSLKQGYQINQSKISIGSGGKYGKGIFRGTQSRLGFIPEKKTDFIFTIIAEEHGFLGVCFILTIYSILILRSFYISINNNIFFEKLFCTSFVIIFFINTLVNICMVSGILPIVGIPLPLISYGGTSLITNICMFGIIMATKKKKEYE